MLHSKVLVLKFSADFAPLYVILGLIYGMSFENVFIIAALLGIIGYILGDMIILPKSSNVIATAADFSLAFLFIWFLISILTYEDNVITMSLIASLGIALFEFFFHNYVINSMKENKIEDSSINHVNLRYNTELSDDLTPFRP